MKSVKKVWIVSGLFYYNLKLANFWYNCFMTSKYMCAVYLILKYIFSNNIHITLILFSLSIKFHIDKKVKPAYFGFTFLFSIYYNLTTITPFKASISLSISLSVSIFTDILSR